MEPTGLFGCPENARENKQTNKQTNRETKYKARKEILIKENLQL